MALRRITFITQVWVSNLEPAHQNQKLIQCILSTYSLIRYSLYLHEETFLFFFVLHFMKVLVNLHMLKHY